MINPMETEAGKDVYIAVLERQLLGATMDSLRLAALVEIKDADSSVHDDELLDWAKKRAEERLGGYRNDVKKMAQRSF
ncbi:hypothetical protein WOJTEK_34 [Gordonia phage Wojtek]|uniref:Uncharacterized protein n=1 Tax=Gordonia phage Wojtek TaxID=2910758 RepID=A0AA49BMU6_9CAUD|nr:hypothetical protein WOJTEK_34 [Gordonia phage Wojtek]